MKSMILFACLFMVTGHVTAQFFNSSKLPIGVKTNFHQQFPGARNIHWGHSNQGYEVNFESQRHKNFGLYGSDGSAILLATEMPTAKLPRSIRKLLKADYTDFVIESAEKIKDQNGFVYSAEIARAEEGYSLLFDSEGRLRSIVPMEENGK